MTNAQRSACLAQIIEGEYLALDWMSDSSPAKTTTGKVHSLEIGKRGLVICLTNGKRVSWRMTEADAKAISVAFYSTSSQVFAGQFGGMVYHCCPELRRAAGMLSRAFGFLRVSCEAYFARQAS